MHATAYVQRLMSYELDLFFHFCVGPGFELRLPGIVLILLLCEYDIRFEITEAKSKCIHDFGGYC